MRTIAFALFAAVLCAGAAHAADTASKTPSAKYYVTVDGHIAPVNGNSLEATLTFSHDIQVPGATLPAGTYLFTLVSSNTMRITSEDRSKLYTTFSTTPVSRARRVNRAQLRFERMPDGSTRLIGLYPDGSSSGYAPMFRKSQKQPGAPIATSGTAK